MVDNFDWRLQGQERFLQGAVLERLNYSPSRPDWDHDHCAFCGAKFAAAAIPGALADGFTTPNRAHWICATCFDDFRERFGWSLIGPDA